MQSFAVPRPTSNPYIHMLDGVLASTPGVEHLHFDRRRALLGDYDAIHMHWPETLLGGSTPTKTMLRRAFASALRIRLTLSPVALIRTVHNVELPQDVSPWERRYLEWVERRTDHRIVLNELTPVPAGSDRTLIPHGHYQGWFADVPRVESRDDTLAFVGLVRRYKGVESLIEAFARTADVAPDLRLRIAGNPTGRAIERAVREQAATDPRVELELGYLSESGFATAIMQSRGVVLPYRFMHNSGATLASLSLDRPVLVPQSPVNDALSAEVGDGWITSFEGELTPETLLRFAEATKRRPPQPPDLSARGWDRAGVAHRDAFRAAVAGRRRRAA